MAFVGAQFIARKTDFRDLKIAPNRERNFERARNDYWQ